MDNTKNDAVTEAESDPTKVLLDGANSQSKSEEDVGWNIPSCESEMEKDIKELRPFNHSKKIMKHALRQQAKRRRKNTTIAAGNPAPTQRLTLSPNSCDIDDISCDTACYRQPTMAEVLASIPGFSMKPRKRNQKKLSAAAQLEQTKEGCVDLETPDSILVNSNLRSLLNKHTFSSLPSLYQYKLLQLLPHVDRTGSDSVFRLSGSGLNNEFFARACLDWRERLAEGEFTPENQAKIKAEQEKEKSKLDPWKLKHFEPTWGESLREWPSLPVSTSSTAPMPIQAKPKILKPPPPSTVTRLRTVGAVTRAVTSYREKRAAQSPPREVEVKRNKQQDHDLKEEIIEKRQSKEEESRDQVMDNQFPNVSEVNEVYNEPKNEIVNIEKKYLESEPSEDNGVNIEVTVTNYLDNRASLQNDSKTSEMLEIVKNEDVAEIFEQDDLKTVDNTEHEKNYNVSLPTLSDNPLKIESQQLVNIVEEIPQSLLLEEQNNKQEQHIIDSNVLVMPENILEIQEIKNVDIPEIKELKPSLNQENGLINKDDMSAIINLPVTGGQLIPELHMASEPTISNIPLVSEVVLPDIPVSCSQVIRELQISNNETQSIEEEKWEVIQVNPGEKEGEIYFKEDEAAILAAAWNVVGSSTHFQDLHQPVSVIPCQEELEVRLHESSLPAPQWVDYNTSTTDKQASGHVKLELEVTLTPEVDSQVSSSSTEGASEPVRVIPPTTIVCLPPLTTSAPPQPPPPPASSSALPYLALTTSTPVRAVAAKPLQSKGSSGGRGNRGSNKPPPGAVNLERSYQICQAVIQNSPNRHQLRCQLKPPPSLLAKRIPQPVPRQRPRQAVVLRHVFTSNAGIPVSMAVLPSHPSHVGGVRRSNSAPPSNSESPACGGRGRPASVGGPALSCACSLRPLVPCRRCGDFCHEDCITPSRLCITCDSA